MPPLARRNRNGGRMELEQTLAQKSRRAFHWYYAGAVARIVLSFGTNILLARLLGPVPFGEMALVLIVVSVGNLVSNAGIPAALVQRPTLTKTDIRVAFTLQMLVGAAISLLVWSTAPAIAALFAHPILAPLLRTSAPVFLLQAFGSTASALLQRQHRARTLQTAFLLSYAIGFLGLAIPMALLGQGVWALIAAQLVQAGANSALLYSKVRHSIVPRLRSSSGGLLSFGAKVLVANLCSWGILNLDNALVGRFWGSFQLGLYSRAFSLAQTPADTVTSSVQQVLLPSVAQADERRARLCDIHAAIFGFVLLLLGPVFASMAATPGLVIRGLYGEAWIAAAPLFRPLALAIPLHAAMAIAGPMLMARGRPQLETACQFISLLLAGAVYGWAVAYSVVWLSWAVLGVYLVRCLIVSGVVIHVSGGRWRALASVSWPAALASSIAVFSALGSKLILPAAWAPLRLMIAVATVGMSLAGLWLAMGPALLRPMQAKLPQIVTIVPRWMRKMAWRSDSFL